MSEEEQSDRERRRSILQWYNGHAAGMKDGAYKERERIRREVEEAPGWTMIEGVPCDCRLGGRHKGTFLKRHEVLAIIDKEGNES